MMTRKLRPRPAVSAAPLCVSDLTAFDLVGLTAAQYRELLRRHPDVPRAVVGHRVLVRADVLLALVDRLAAVNGTSTAEVPAAEDNEPLTEAEVLARLGMRKAG